MNLLGTAIILGISRAGSELADPVIHQLLSKWKRYTGMSDTVQKAIRGGLGSAVVAAPIFAIGNAISEKSHEKELTEKFKRLAKDSYYKAGKRPAVILVR